MKVDWVWYFQWQSKLPGSLHDGAVALKLPFASHLMTSLSSQEKSWMTRVRNCGSTSERPWGWIPHSIADVSWVFACYFCKRRQTHALFIHVCCERRDKIASRDGTVFDQKHFWSAAAAETHRLWRVRNSLFKLHQFATINTAKPFCFWHQVKDLCRLRPLLSECHKGCRCSVVQPVVGNKSPLHSGLLDHFPLGRHVVIPPPE